MKYVGELYFLDGDIMDVTSLIFRSGSEISYSVVASWDGQGKWSKSGIASFNGQSFSSDEKPSTQVETGKIGPACKITFSKIEKSEDFLIISGQWHENGESYSFEGDLEIQR